MEHRSIIAAVHFGPLWGVFLKHLPRDYGGGLVCTYLDGIDSHVHPNGACQLKGGFVTCVASPHIRPNLPQCVRIPSFERLRITLDDGSDGRIIIWGR